MKGTDYILAEFMLKIEEGADGHIPFESIPHLKLLEANGWIKSASSGSGYSVYYDYSQFKLTSDGRKVINYYFPRSKRTCSDFLDGKYKIEE
ncbi:hypothetical protein N9955_00695 [bacterium]|nr:hypothetical protein [bacterium]